MIKFVQRLGRLFYRMFVGVFIGVFWAILLVTLFSNLYIIGILFKPIPAEILAGLLWTLLYSRFLIYLWKRHNLNFHGYVAGSILPLLLAAFFSLIVCFVRTPFRDGIKTIEYLEQYKINHGAYPENIQLVNYNTSANYTFNQSDGSFSQIYQIGLFESAFYDSKTRKWRGDLPVGGVPYDILGIEQMMRDSNE